MKNLIITMPDGSRWTLPIEVIARHRAAYYADEFGGDVERSLAEDTMPLIQKDHGELKDWGKNNMNWNDVQPHARLLEPRAPLDASEFQDGWMNGEWEVE